MYEASNGVQVSLIIPVYNGEKYLRRCLESVISQTLESLEILVIDDCSVDASSHIIQEYASKDNRIKVVYKQKNEGISETRNKGLDLAVGEYVAFCDHDDVMEPQMLERMYAKAAEKNVDVLQCGYYTEKPDGRIMEMSFSKNEILWGAKQIRDNILPLLVGPINFVEVQSVLPFYAVWNHVYKKSFLDRHGIRFISRKEVNGEDTTFNVQVYTFAEKYLHINEKLYYWLQNENSTSVKYREDAIATLMQEYSWKSNFLVQNTKGAYDDSYTKRNNAWLTLNLSYAVFVCVRTFNKYSKFCEIFNECLCSYETMKAFEHLPQTHYGLKMDVFVFLFRRRKRLTIFIMSNIFMTVKRILVKRKRRISFSQL